MALAKRRRRVSIVVCDPVPIRRRGLVVALEDAGFSVDEVAEIDLDESRDPDRVVIWTCQSAELGRAASGSGCVIAVLEHPSPDDYQVAFARGASAVVDQDSSPEELVHTVTEALAGRTLLPTEVAHEIAVHPGTVTRPEGLSEEERDWLTWLAQGRSVPAVAMRAGMSERDMYRALHDLYERIGARNRVEAIAIATRWRLVS